MGMSSKYETMQDLAMSVICHVRYLMQCESTKLRDAAPATRSNERASVRDLAARSRKLRCGCHERLHANRVDALATAAPRSQAARRARRPRLAQER